MNKNSTTQKMSLVKKIILGITGSLKHISIVVFTVLGFTIIGFILAFPLWFLSLKARILFNILILILAGLFFIYFLINKFNAEISSISITRFKKIAFVFINIIGAFSSFLIYFINLSVAMYLAPCLVFLSLVLNRALKNQFSFSRGFCYLIIFINFISFLYNALLFSVGTLSWFTPILILWFIPSLGYFLFENRRISKPIQK